MNESTPKHGLDFKVKVTECHVKLNHSSYTTKGFVAVYEFKRK